MFWKKPKPRIEEAKKLRDYANTQYMSLEKAVWLAADRAAVDQFDKVAKRLLFEISAMRAERGEPKPVGDWTK